MFLFSSASFFLGLILALLSNISSLTDFVEIEAPIPGYELGNATGAVVWKTAYESQDIAATSNTILIQRCTLQKTSAMLKVVEQTLSLEFHRREHEAIGTILALRHQRGDGAAAWQRKADDEGRRQQEKSTASGHAVRHV